MTDPEPGPPTVEAIQVARGEARREAEATDRQAKLNSREVRQLVDGAARWSGLAAIAFSTLIAVAFGLLFLNLAGQIGVAEAIRLQDQRETEAALDSLRRDSAILESRGQPAVPVPATGDPREIEVAALVAKALTRLPPVPTAEQVAAVVGPAADVRVTGPPAEEIGDQVAAYFRINADALRGQAGQPPSEQQIRVAVAAELAANPPPPGRPGDDGTDGRDGTNGRDGADGVSVTGQQFLRTDSGCVSRVTYSDGRSEDRPAGDAACPDPPEEPTTPQPTTETTPTP